ncbi:MAG: hypothetical protein RIC95_05955 [Vicingaceae bacterium]
MNKGKKIIDEINATVKSWKDYAEEAAVRSDLKERINENLNTF